eukprot:TRINITY_DN101376_c0_g1_i1.p1 TRINITY_DN101376_c0_g1~~TRINITY_DN101376_c0_g1_i1.p1  ORF type:complete len:616 (+),score=117.33 TRINITY_DN101376_c0_g1_i1:158-2005(+)
MIVQTVASDGSVAKLSFIDNYREEYRRAAGLSAHVGVEELARYFRRLAEEAHHRLGRATAALDSREKEVIALTAAHTLRSMDILGLRQVRLEDWVHYMLLRGDAVALRQINTILVPQVRANPKILSGLQVAFAKANLSGSGFLSLSELAEMYRTKQWYLRPGSNVPLTESELAAGLPDQYALELLKLMDVDGDGQVSYAEFMNYSVGRRKYKVSLHLYDLSEGQAETLGPLIVGQPLDGIWHTGIVVFGKEYYYATDTVFDNAGETGFGKPDRVCHLGYTLWKQDELHEFIVTELKPLFQRETYDVVQNNCNHFTDKVSMFLLGRHVPDEVLSQPQHLMKSPFVQVLRPMLNWYLRDRVIAREVETCSTAMRFRCEDNPKPGSVVLLHDDEAKTCTPVGAAIMSPAKAATPVMAVVRSSEQYPIQRGWPPGSVAGCSGRLLCCTTNAAVSEHAAAFQGVMATPVPPGHVLVQYCRRGLIDIADGPDVQVICEAVPLERLSYVAYAKDLLLQELQGRALRQLGVDASAARQRPGASRGLDRPTNPALSFQEPLPQFTIDLPPQPREISRPHREERAFSEEDKELLPNRLSQEMDGPSPGALAREITRETDKGTCRI